MKNYQCGRDALLVVVILLLNGCTALGPDFKQPKSQLPAQWSSKGSEAFAEKPEANHSEWWTQFDDPTLDNLIETAYQQNLTLKTAGLRILEARARLGLVEGNMYPQSQSMNGDLFTIGTTSPAPERYYNSTSIGFDAAWELDFWGKFRRSIESADSSLLAEIANYDDVLVTLTAEIARLYINIRTYEKRIQLSEKNADIQRKVLEIVQYQFDAGVVTELDLLQAKTLLSTTLATIPGFDNLLQKNRNGLAILLGLLPGKIDDLLDRECEIPVVSSEIAVGIPAELLRRRPDIRQAEMQAAAQSAQLGVTVTELYPSFTLFGSLGWSANDIGDNSLGDVFSSDSFHYSFGPSFKWNLLNYGRIKNEVRIQDARLEQYITLYQDTVINAAREVEDSMSGVVYIQKQAEYIREGVVTSKKSMELSLLQYEEGLVDYQRVLDSIRSMTQKQDQYAQLRGEVATEFVSLYKALGGGWEIRIGNDFVSDELKQKMQERTDWGEYFDD